MPSPADRLRAASGSAAEAMRTITSMSPAERRQAADQFEAERDVLAAATEVVANARRNA